MTQGEPAKADPVPQDSAAHAVQTRLRVRYAETDQMGVVHHANYLIWFEAARSEFCRSRGIDYPRLEQLGYFLPIVEAHVRYIAPACYDDEVVVSTTMIAVKRRTLRMGYTVTRGETLLATGETYQIVVGPDKRPRVLPGSIVDLFSR